MDSKFEQLRHDLAEDEQGAEARLHRHAGEIYGLMGSEVALPYYELILICAEHVRRNGMVTREQTLLRRALLIAGQMGSDPENAKERLALSIRWPEIPTALSSERIVVAIDSLCDLWRWQPQVIDFVPSGPAPYRWYMLAPVSWRGQVEKRAARMIEIIHARCNTRLAAREPTDANYIGVQPARIAEMTRDELLAEAWQMAPTTWSETRGFVVEDNEWFFASDANDFVPMAHLSMVVSGALDNDISMARLRTVGFSGEIIERQSEPVKELADALAYYLQPK